MGHIHIQLYFVILNLYLRKCFVSLWLTKILRLLSFFVLHQGKITIYNTVILVHSFIKFLDRNFLFIEKVQAFLDLILSRALASKDNIKF